MYQGHILLGGILLVGFVGCDGCGCSARPFFCDEPADKLADILAVYPAEFLKHLLGILGQGNRGYDLSLFHSYIIS